MTRGRRSAAVAAVMLGTAAALLTRVAELPSLENDDPWGFYATTVGRFFGPSHQDIAESLRMEMPR